MFCSRKGINDEFFSDKILIMQASRIEICFFVTLFGKYEAIHKSCGKWHHIFATRSFLYSLYSM